MSFILCPAELCLFFPTCVYFLCFCLVIKIPQWMVVCLFLDINPYCKCLLLAVLHRWWLHSPLVPQDPLVIRTVTVSLYRYIYLRLTILYVFCLCPSFMYTVVHFTVYWMYSSSSSSQSFPSIPAHRHKTFLRWVMMTWIDFRSYSFHWWCIQGATHSREMRNEFYKNHLYSFHVKWLIILADKLYTNRSMSKSNFFWMCLLFFYRCTSSNSSCVLQEDGERRVDTDWVWDWSSRPENMPPK